MGQKKKRKVGQIKSWLGLLLEEKRIDPNLMLLGIRIQEESF